MECDLGGSTGDGVEVTFLVAHAIVNGNGRISAYDVADIDGCVIVVDAIKLKAASIPCQLTGRVFSGDKSRLTWPKSHGAFLSRFQADGIGFNQLTALGNHFVQNDAIPC